MAFTTAGVIAGIGAAAAAGGTALSASQANRANKEQNRQKSIAAAQQAEQAKLVEEQKAAEKAKADKLKLDLEEKQRRDTAKANEVSAVKRKAKLRGRRSLITQLETGVEDDTLG